MWLGMVVLCIAGTDLNTEDASCLTYVAKFESQLVCELSLNNVLNSEEIQAMTSLPEYDLDLVYASCEEGIEV
jgi:hypothetical protein